MVFLNICYNNSSEDIAAKKRKYDTPKFLNIHEKILNMQKNVTNIYQNSKKPFYVIIYSHYKQFKNRKINL